ncbi:uncharacterized protein LOC133904470 [Phragmites australis]|uniref:uncharacterized protein LOC133904470 n=1 Tax=Phragmites australis TaxID=29695 RepID=UPI002D76D486|nr:uncharacterized protein LOC133904470 [Phragmites australis]
MSVGSKSFPTRRDCGCGEGGAGGGENGDGAVVREESKGGSRNGRKEARYDRCFSGMELSIGPGPLKDMDAGKLKGQIRRWAKAVVAYARQISFGSPRSRSRSASSPTSGGGDTPSSATFPASKSGRLGGAKNEPPTT